MSSSSDWLALVSENDQLGMTLAVKLCNLSDEEKRQLGEHLDRFLESATGLDLLIVHLASYGLGVILQNIQERHKEE